MKVLNILSSAYRATMEEQDDTVLWLTQTIKRAGADIDLLLRGAAANYTVEGQQVAPLALGGRQQRNAPDVHGALRALAEDGARIFVLDDDIERYGLRECPRLAQAELIEIDALADLLCHYDRVWHW